MDGMYCTTWAKSTRAGKTYRWHVSHCTRKASVQSKRDGLWRKRSERNPSNQYMLEDPRFKLAVKTFCRTTRGKGCVATNIFTLFAVFQMSHACLHAWCWEANCVFLRGSIDPEQKFSEVSLSWVPWDLMHSQTLTSCFLSCFMLHIMSHLLHVSCFISCFMSCFM